MAELILSEHCSENYAPRTRRNASLGHVTAAFALDYATVGEKLTKSAAGPKYFAVTADMVNPSRRLAEFIQIRREGKPVTLNIAGNSLNTFARRGWTQDIVNQVIYDILKQTHSYYPIDRIISGGQTGADIAGIIAAIKLGVPAEAMFPRGFKQRAQSGTDHFHTKARIERTIMGYVEALV